MTRVRIEGPQAKVIDGREVLRKTFEEATISLFPELAFPPVLSNKDPHQFRVAFFVDEDAERDFRDAFGENLGRGWRLHILRDPGNRKPEEIAAEHEAHKAAISSVLDDFDQLVFTAQRKDDFTLIDHARITNSSALQRKGLVLLQTTPHEIPPDLMRKVAFAGSFSKHPLSYKADVKLLTGELQPHSTSRLPLRLPGETDGDRVVPFEPTGGMQRINIANDTEVGRLTSSLQVARDENRLLQSSIDDLKKQLAIAKEAAEPGQAIRSVAVTVVGAGLCVLCLMSLLMAVGRILKAKRKPNDPVRMAKSLWKQPFSRFAFDSFVFTSAAVLTVATLWNQALSWLVFLIFVVCCLVFLRVFFSQVARAPAKMLSALALALSDWVVLAWLGAAVIAGFLVAASVGTSLGDALGGAFEILFRKAS